MANNVFPHPQATALAGAFTRHFAAADRDVEWLGVEVSHSMELAPGVVLVGVIDAYGRTAEGDLFFGEWKTASKWGAKNWKLTWRMNPQSLTYGVLMADLMPGCERFTVRKAFKADPPTCDFAWYRYSPGELAHWRSQLLTAAHEIAAYPVVGPWPTNFNACFRYGPDYACPFFDPACSRQQWDARPAGAVVQISPMREKELRRLNEGDVNGVGNSQVVLSASSIATWFECRERYRREYVEGLSLPPGEALTIGSDFHALLGAHYRTLIKV
jgi:hypothetical protein